MPITYQGKNGKQYVAIFADGGDVRGPENSGRPAIRFLVTVVVCGLAGLNRLGMRRMTMLSASDGLGLLRMSDSH